MKKNITLTGMMGAGKSLIAAKLFCFFNEFIAVDIDEVIEYHQNQSITQIFEQKGELYFRDLETNVLNKVYQQEGRIVALGGGAFEREENRQIAKDNSAVFYLKASAEVLFERVKNAQNRPLLKAGFGVESVANILEKREKNYCLADYVIFTDNKNADLVVQEILGLVNDRIEIKS